MASVFRRCRWVRADGARVSEHEAQRLIAAGEPVERREGHVWYLRYRDETGRMVDSSSRARGKREAQRLAEEAERRAERVRRGLEVGLPPDGGGTLAALMEWWLATYSKPSPSHGRNESVVRKHIIASDIARLPLTQVTAAKVEAFLQAKTAEGLGPESVNHIRGFISRAFGAARKVGRYAGASPVADVKKRRVPKRVQDHLRASEIPAVLAALAPEWRPLFATAIYTGMRKGELFALRKTDVDLDQRHITVRRSHERDTTKGGHADRVPIPAELVPFLKAAIATSPSGLVFPRPEGTRWSETTRLSDKLRRAMARAGIVEGYRYTCRARVNGEGKRDPKAARCTHAEVAPDKAPRRCPLHGDLLWPVPQVRSIRFMDTRHTAGTHLAMRAGLAVAQRVLRHSDPKITAKHYADLDPYMLGAVDQALSFGVAGPAEPPAEAPRAVAGAGVLDSMLDRAPEKKKGRNSEAVKPSDSGPLEWRAIQDSNLWPSAPEADALSS